jgi:hypothetical protein
MSDPITVPGVRVGQVWQEIRARKGRNRRRVEVTGLGLGDVYGFAVNTQGSRYGKELNLHRGLFEQRFELASEGAV